MIPPVCVYQSVYLPVSGDIFMRELFHYLIIQNTDS